MELQIIANVSHGTNLKSEASTDSFYFCRKGLNAVLGRSDFNSISISFRSMKDSILVEVTGQTFKSQFGSFEACHDHPAAIFDLMGRKSEGVKKNFKFYVKLA